MPALLRYVQGLIAGLHPMAHPSAPAVEAMARPEFETMCSDFETDLAGAVELLLRGALHSWRSRVGGLRHRYARECQTAARGPMRLEEGHRAGRSTRAPLDVRSGPDERAS